MTQVLLGQSGLKVSPVCFGTWQLSPRFWGDQSKDEILKAMRAARDAGITIRNTLTFNETGKAKDASGKAK